LQGASTVEQDVDYAITQAINLYHSGDKPRAIRTFVRLLGIKESSVASEIRCLNYAAIGWDIDKFVSRLKLFAGNHVPGYGHRTAQ
jgi:hypothetical protein